MSQNPNTPTFDRLHEECKGCGNLRIFSLDMGGNHIYACNRTPNKIIKEKHKSPCERYEPEIE